MRPDGGLPEQRAEERLRDALRARAAEVELSTDALPRIRARTARRRGFAGGWAMAGAAAATVAAIVAAAIVVGINADKSREIPPSTEKSGTPTQIASPSPTPSTGPSGKGVSLPVYFVHNGKLYREFHPVQLDPDTDQARIRKAVELSLAGAADDPDYRSLWPAGTTVADVTISGALVTVDLSQGGPETQAATQQLVYTVAAASTYTSIRHADGVRIRAGSADTGVLRQAPLVDVQAPVWVIEPAQGAVVGKSFTVYVAGVVFEGTVNVRVRETGTGRVVDERVVQLSVGAPQLGEAHVPLTLPAGKYRVEAWFVSMKDSSVQWLDDHDFAVG